MKKIGRFLSIFTMLLLTLMVLMPTAFAEMRRDRAVATYVTFQFRHATTGVPITGATAVDCEISKFKNTVTPPALADAAAAEAEIGSTGVYVVALSGSEMNSRFILLKCTSTSADAVPFVDVINTEPYPPAK